MSSRDEGVNRWLAEVAGLSIRLTYNRLRRTSQRRCGVEAMVVSDLDRVSQVRWLNGFSNWPTGRPNDPVQQTQGLLSPARGGIPIRPLKYVAFGFVGVGERRG